ncbi:sensor histidine kinase [Algoriphagus limi]|uniref:histidine kinase n=1 Tax=Algoriphagus limi TaxID=2975273 RepID=A0ABT2G7R2_9BACT|nr:ATP-binding protein [Algoriphagus limi]MCS5491314.1 ATP-binding protein [Algoriphagus limi]
MNKHMHSFRLQVFLLFSIGLAVACQSDTTVLTPENPSNFQIPSPVPFEIPEGKTIEWKTIPIASVPKGRKISFNWDRLPSKPFSLEEEVPLKQQITEIPFNWEELNEVALNLKLESDSIHHFILPLPDPIISEAGIPQKTEGTKAGVLELSSRQGLPGNSVIAQVIAPDGTHWLSTEQGLIKYTGTEFHLFDILTRDYSAGGPNFIADLDIDSSGRMIISTTGSGIIVLNPEAELLEYFELPYGFTRGGIDQDGNYWGGMIGDIPKLIDLKNIKVYSLVFEADELPLFSALSVDSKNNLWICYNSGIAIISPEREKVKFIGNSEGIFGDFSGTVESPDGSVWLESFQNGINNISLERGIISRIGEEHGYTNDAININVDRKGQVWLAHTNGFSIFNPDKSAIKTIQTNLRLFGSGPPAVSIIDEEEGIYWLGTITNGLLIYDPMGMDSRHLSSSDGLIDNNVWGIEEDDEHRVWLATYGGLNIYDPTTKTIKYLEIPSHLSSNNHRGISKISEETFFLGSYGGFSFLNLKESTITSFQGNTETALIFWRARLLKDGKIWIATNNGLIVLDQENGSMKKIDQSSGLSSNIVWGLEEDQQGKVWVVTDSGINMIDPEKNTITYLGSEQGLSSIDQSAIFKTSENEIIIGGSGGISIINEKQNQITSISSKHGLIPDRVFDIIESNNRLELGTSDGIVVIEKPSEDDPNQPWRFMNYGRAEGSPFTDYNQMTAKATKEGKVWWGASPIVTVNLQNPELDANAPANVELTGIRIMDQTANFFIKAEQGRVLSSTDSLTSGLENVQGYLKKNTIKWDSLDPKTKVPLGLSLPHDQNSLTFTFSNPSIRGRDEIVYKYVLEGADEEWSEVTDKPFSKTYFNLFPGDYTFKVISKGFNGVWSEPATYSFTINLPWWLKWWAFLVYATLLALLIYTIVQIRSYYLQKENRLLEERVNQRTAELNQSLENLKATQEQLIQSEKMASLGELTAGIAHEIKNPLNFVNNFSEVSEELLDEMNEEIESGNLDEVKSIAVDLKENLSKIKHHGKRADSIVKGMLEHSRSNSGEKTPTDLNALADEYLRLSYHGFRAKDKSFQSDFRTDFESKLPKVNVVAQDIGRVLLNLINNAFYAVDEKAKSNSKSTEGAEGYQPEVVVRTKKNQNEIEISVTDNGNGIPDSVKDKIFQPFFTTKPAGSGTGLGLSLSYDIIKAHGGTFDVQSEVGKGTQFTIKLPLKSI